MHQSTVKVSHWEITFWSVLTEMECEKRKCLLLETKIEILRLVDECQMKKSQCRIVVFVFKFKIHKMRSNNSLMYVGKLHCDI